MYGTPSPNQFRNKQYLPLNCSDRLSGVDGISLDSTALAKSSVSLMMGGLLSLAVRHSLSLATIHLPSNYACSLQ